MPEVSDRDARLTAIAFALGIPRDEPPSRHGETGQGFGDLRTQQDLELLKAFRDIESTDDRAFIVRIVNNLLSSGVPVHDAALTAGTRGVTFRSTRLPVRRDAAAVIAFKDDRLVGIFARLDDPSNGADRSCWFMECGFGPFAAPQSAVFSDLDAVERWIEETVRE